MKLIRLTDEQLEWIRSEVTFSQGVYQELEDEDGGYEADLQFFEDLQKHLNDVE